MGRITSITLIILVSGTLIDGALALGFAINVELLTACTALGSAQLWLRSRCIRSGATERAQSARASLGVGAAILLAALVTLVTPATIIRLLAGGQDNGGWLYVSSQLTAGGPVWSGYGGPLTLVLSAATGLARLIVVAIGGTSESALIPLLALSIVTAFTIGVALLLAIQMLSPSRARFPAAGAVLVLTTSVLAFLDYGHLSALLVFLALAGALILFPSSTRSEQSALLWIAALAMGLWLPLRPLLIPGIAIALWHSWTLRRRHMATKGLVVIDVMTVLPPVLLSLRSLVVHVEATPTFATSLPAVSLSGLVDGVADLLARSGGTHTVPLAAAGLVALIAFHEARLRGAMRTPVFGFVALLLAWAFTFRLVDQIVNGGSAYGSQKLLLLASPIALLWLIRYADPGRLLVSCAVAVVLIPVVWSIIEENRPSEAQQQIVRGNTWIDALASDIGQPVGKLPVGCVTDPTWEAFDDPVADDVAVNSAYTCTRFLGSLAARSDLPNELLEFNVGEVTWRDTVRLLPQSQFQSSDIIILNGDRSPYRVLRLLDLVAESAGIRELEVQVAGEAPNLGAPTSLSHSIDLIDYDGGFIAGWVGPEVASLVVVSEIRSPQPPHSVPLTPRRDVEELLGPRGLPSGFRVSMGEALTSDSCLYLIGRDGEPSGVTGAFSC